MPSRPSVDSPPAPAEGAALPDDQAVWLLDAVRTAVGSGVSYAEPPVALDSSFGAHAYGFEVDGAAVPEGWQGSLVARLALTGDDSIGREAAALGFASRNDYPVPAVLAVVDGDEDAFEALVTARPTGDPMLARIAADPDHTNQVLNALGTGHAALHTLPVDDEVDGALPALVLEDELAAIDANAYAAERSWLIEHQPEPAAPVVCHGCYQPLVVSGEEGTVRNWSGAVLADPAYDVGFTLLAFWSAPFYTGTRAERAGLKMIRDMLTNVYRGGYESVAGPQGDRLKYWQAFHLLRAAAAASGALTEGTPSVIPASVDPVPADLAKPAQKLFTKLTR